MREVGVVVLMFSVVGAGCMFLLWILGFIFHIGGGLIHLLLVIAPLFAVVGFAIGLLLIIKGKE